MLPAGPDARPARCKSGIARTRLGNAGHVAQTRAARRKLTTYLLSINAVQVGVDEDGQAREEVGPTRGFS